MRNFTQQNLVHAAFLFRNRHVEPGSGSIIEEDRSRGDIEADTRDAEEDFDIRDLLLDDETD